MSNIFTIHLQKTTVVTQQGGPVAQLVELSLLTRTTRVRVPPEWKFFPAPLSTQQQMGSWDLRDLAESTLR